MKKVLCMILSLIMVLSLIGVMSVVSLADAEDGLTVIVTGGTGDAIGGEGLNFTAAAALKASYDENEVLLVDAGGFAGSAPAIMTAAGYDLIVPENALTDWDITSISMGVSGLSAGVMFEKNGVKAAFVGVVPRGGQEEEEYYANIQAAVTASRDKGAAYVVALGLVDDAEALIDNVSGISVILTYGDESSVGKITEDGLVVAVDRDASATDADEEAADEEDADEEDAAEEAADEAQENESVRAVVLTVGKRFGSIGKLTLKTDGVAAENLKAEQYTQMELEESEIIRALEAACKTSAVEDPTEDGEPADDEEPAGDEETDDDEETAGDEEPAGDEETAGEEEPAGDEQSAEDEQPAGDEQPDETEQPAETESTPEPTEEPIVEPTPVAGQEEDASETDAEEPTATPEPTVEPTPEVVHYDTDEDKDSPTDYTRGSVDLKLDFDHPVSAVFVSDNGSLKTFEPQYYTLSGDSKSVSIHADVLNAWGDGNYPFAIRFADGTEDKNIIVSISGSYTAPTATPEPTATAAPADTAAPGSTPAATAASSAAPQNSNSGSGKSTPLTGDDSPILLYAIILVVLIAALAVVIILVARKKKNGVPDTSVEHDIPDDPDNT